MARYVDSDERALREHIKKEIFSRSRVDVEIKDINPSLPAPSLEESVSIIDPIPSGVEFGAIRDAAEQALKSQGYSIDGRYPPIHSQAYSEWHFRKEGAEGASLRTVGLNYEESRRILKITYHKIS